MKFWQISSRWHQHAKTPEKIEETKKYSYLSSILAIFRKYNIIFGYLNDKQKEDFEKIEEGDLIAISDGIKKIAAIGKALTYAQSLTRLNANFSKVEIEDCKKRIGLNLEDFNIMGIKINIINLEENTFGSEVGTFYQITDDNIKEKIQDLWTGKEVDITNLHITYGKS